MSSREVNLTDPVQKGDTLGFAFRWAWPDGTPRDMRGRELVFTMKLSPFIPDEEATVVVHKPLLMDDDKAAKGEAVIVVPRSQSQDLIAGVRFHYGLRVIQQNTYGDDPEPLEITHVYGTVPVKDA